MPLRVLQPPRHFPFISFALTRLRMSLGTYLNYYIIAPALYFGNVTVFPGKRFVSSPSASACCNRCLHSCSSTAPKPVTHNTSRPVPGGLNVFGTNTSAHPHVPGGYFALDSTLTPYNGPPYLSSTTYGTFIGIAFSLVGGLVDAIDEFRAPIWSVIKPSAVLAKTKSMFRLVSFYLR